MEKEKIKNLNDVWFKRFKEIETLISQPLFHQNHSYASLSKEHRNLSQNIEKATQWEKGLNEMCHLEEMIQSSDKELSELAKIEKENLEKKINLIEQELLQCLIPKDPLDDKNIILEIRAGTGGDESSLFAQELARMYARFAEINGFICETISLSLSDRGGFKEAIFSIEEGANKKINCGAWGLLKYERGVHRVQRVPVTESSGRIHTSTVTVAVLIEAEEVDVAISPQDLRIDTYRASGHGGQHLQKTDSAVRITHLPTSIVVQCQDERSQQRNREKAMKFLRAKLYQAAKEAKEKELRENRKKQVGTGERSEKIRTYNFPQDRITDHRIGESIHHIQEVLDGNLGPMVKLLQLAENDKRERESLDHS